MPYAAAEAELNAAAEGLALAFGPDVRVDTLMAGPYRTDATAGWTSTTSARTTTRSPPTASNASAAPAKSSEPHCFSPPTPHARTGYRCGA
ncbi:hypothetical protein C5E41_06645 [Nocardia nova]|nr:hypothetical protein C5E41_06645 [Nocardia nova]